KADLAFILHMVNHLATNGTAAVVMFPGTLYRGGAERDIREYLVRNINVVDAIIQLPENLFFGPTISTCIWVLRKNKSDTNVFFVDASNEFIKVTNKNKLTNDNINKIVDTVRFKKEIEHFSKIVNQSEIIDNNFNLSVGSYVEKEDTSEKIDIKVLNNQIKETVSKIDKLRNEIDEIVKMLGD
uniref:N-6 DNA methylase n=1 Tax=Mycoplasmopsis primatum TaxID=55604 RepID=UPI000497BF65